ncbi:MAG: MMPL family transporter, partial [Acidimicrobiales bacterium]
YGLIFSPPANGFGADKSVDAARTVLSRQLPGYRVGLTGLSELSSGGSTKGPGVLVETLIGGAGALLVLAFVFASFLALVPLLVAVVSILTTFLVVLGLTYLTDVSFIVEFLIALVGLGIAIDYSLLLVTRWREERARGADNAGAVVRAVETAVRHERGVIGVTGTGAIEQDYSHEVFGNFPLMLSLIALVTFLLLARAFRSLLLAVKAVVRDVVSLAATFGLMTWFWQQGHGSLTVFSIPATGAVTFWVPLMVLAFLFGLSMDYEVFILTRVREEYDLRRDTDAAVVEGLGRTGRLVTSAALILFLAFASLASAPDTDIKVLATGLGAGILLDATIVRAMLVPALVSLFRRWNWWMPRAMSRALALRPPTEHPRAEPAPVEA